MANKSQETNKSKKTFKRIKMLIETHSINKLLSMEINYFKGLPQGNKTVKLQRKEEPN